MLRLFIGLELPTRIQDHLVPLCSGVKNARWVDAHNMHITLAFIGEVDEATLPDLHDSLSDIRFDPFDLSLAQVDCFESRGKATVLWAGVDGDVDALTRLHFKVQNAISAVGLCPERRKYKPHVTLAWLKKTPKENVMSFIENHNSLCTEHFSISHFSLFRSHLSRHGADYQVLEKYS
jgi:RNA 2',3'-cyclic 3'-phosphodiesterase